MFEINIRTAERLLFILKVSIIIQKHIKIQISHRINTDKSEDRKTR